MGQTNEDMMLDFKDFIVADYKPGEPDIIKYRAHRRHRLGEAIETEALTVPQRLQRKRQMVKYKSKIALGRKRAQRRLASKDKLEKRAVKQARMSIFKKLTKDIPKGDLTYQRRAEIEKRLEKPAIKQRIKMIARKLYPQVRKNEVERKRRASSND
jgi:hypothetical protein